MVSGSCDLHDQVGSSTIAYRTNWYRLTFNGIQDDLFSVQNPLSGGFEGICLHDLDDFEAFDPSGSVDADGFADSGFHECFTHRGGRGDFHDII